MDHAPLNLPLASDFWLGVGVLGKVLVFGGIVFFLGAFIQQLVKVRTRIPCFAIGCVCVFGAFASLGSLFVADQFEYEYVWSHSEKINGLGYKIAAIWSGQQGSFLLWATCSAIFALFALRGVGPYRRGYLASISLFLGSICAILAYETPFNLQLFEGKAFIPPDGTGLAPSLNNYWVIIHPPTIFLGFGSLIVLFAYAVGALASRDYDGWISRVRPWSLISLAILGLGLCMGGFWAYETLGWGGFWMWDPVENVSFVPWVMVVGLVHGIIVQTAKNKWHFSNLLLAGAPFLLFVYGTFLTRSGFLADVSVHSFATMEKNAHKVLLGLLIASLAGFLGLWFQRMVTNKALTARKEPMLERASLGPAKGLHREGMYQLGILFLVLLGAATAIGMSVPLFQALRGKEVKVVEEHLYHLVLSWFFIPTMILMAVAPFASWRRMALIPFLGRILNVFSITLGLVGIAMFVLNNPSVGVQADPTGKIDIFRGQSVPLFGWIVFLFGLCAFVAVANIWRLVEVMRKGKLSGGAFISHLGVAVAMAGLIVSRGFEREQQHVVQAGSTAVPLKEKGIRSFVDLVENQEFKPMDRSNKIAFKFSGPGKQFVATPGLYYSLPPQGGEPAPVVWPHIENFWSHDLYVALQAPSDDVGDAVEVEPGKTVTFTGPVWSNLTERDYKVTYHEIVQEGEAGAASTLFGAKLTVKDPEGHDIELVPKMGVGGQSEPAVLDEEFSISLEGMDAATKTVTLDLKYNRPVMIVHTFYKPLTILVWLGVGILTFGGLLSAWYRRRRAPKISTEAAVENVETNDDALVPVA